MIIQEETFAEHFRDYFKLARENADEVYGDSYSLNTAAFVQLDKVGALRLFGLRDANNNLQGYAVFIVSPLLHEDQTIVASNTTIFIRKEFRAQWAVKMVKFCDEALRESVHRITYSAGMRFSSFFQRLGYRPSNVVFTREC